MEPTELEENLAKVAENISQTEYFGLVQAILYAMNAQYRYGWMDAKADGHAYREDLADEQA